MRVPAVCGVAFLVFAACAPNPAAPVQVMAIVPSATGAYETQQVALTTIKNIVSLNGDVVRLQGGASIEINSKDPLLIAATSEEQFDQVLEKNRGGDPTANLIDKSGVLWPADFHSWAMVTTYYNFEQSYLYFQRVYPGSSAELLGTRVLYWASFKDLDTGSDADQSDNAIWFAPIKAFMVLPFKDFQLVPLSLNIGVVGHEFAHLAFNKKAYGGSGLPAPLGSWTLQPFNLLKSMDEGFADFHGYGVTCLAKGGCRASFLSASIGDAAKPRDLADSTHCLTEELRAAFENFQPDAFINAGLHYKIGTLIATSLYTAALKTGDKTDTLQKSLILAYDDEKAATPGFKQVLSLNLATPVVFTPEKMTDVIASHISDLDLRKAVCNELITRLQLECPGYPCDPLTYGTVDTPLPHCPVGTTRGTTCPALPRRP